MVNSSETKESSIVTLVSNCLLLLYWLHRALAEYAQGLSHSPLMPLLITVHIDILYDDHIRSCTITIRMRLLCRIKHVLMQNGKSIPGLELRLRPHLSNLT